MPSRRRRRRGPRSLAALTRRALRNTQLTTAWQLQKERLEGDTADLETEVSGSLGAGHALLPLLTGRVSTASEETRHCLETTTDATASPLFCETDLREDQREETHTVLHLNARGVVKNQGELEAHLALLGAPDVVVVTETLLSGEVPDFTLTGYEPVARLDRKDRAGGGVAVFAKDSLNSVVLLEYATTAERCWVLLHTDRGPLLLGAWYWPPDADLAAFDSLEEEYLRLSQLATGVLLVGDFNAHHTHWLKHSGPTNSKGRALKQFCDDHNLLEYTKVPTRPRSKNLLDLTLSDLGDAVSTVVVPGVSDHDMVKVTVQGGLPKRTAVTRFGWTWKKAKWNKLRGLLQENRLEKLRPQQ